MLETKKKFEYRKKLLFLVRRFDRQEKTLNIFVRGCAGFKINFRLKFVRFFSGKLFIEIPRNSFHLQYFELINKNQLFKIPTVKFPKELQKSFLGGKNNFQILK